MSDDEFGPWIEHDGTGFPPALIGQFIHAVGEYHDGRMGETLGIPVRIGERAGAWDWSNYRKWNSTCQWRYARVLRYRVKKPLGLTILEGLLENLPTPTDRVSA